MSTFTSTERQAAGRLVLGPVEDRAAAAALRRHGFEFLTAAHVLGVTTWFMAGPPGAAGEETP